jgi:hypothetical protein
MYDIWLTESTNIVREIIKNSDLKKYVMDSIDRFINSDKFEEWLNKTVEGNISEFVEKYVKETIEDYGDDFHPSVNEEDVKQAVLEVIERKFKQ